MPRRLAHEVLTRVLTEDAYSHIALDVALERDERLSPRDRGLATELVYGTLTWLPALDTLIGKVVKGGVRRLDEEVLLVLRLSAYQMIWLDRVPDHAIIDEAVKLTQNVHRRAAPLVNGALRALARARDQGDVQWWRAQDREKKPVRYLSQRYALPSWIANRLWQMLGTEQAELAAAAFCARPVTWARQDRASGSEGCGEVPEGTSPHPSLPLALRADAGLAQLLRGTGEAGELAIQDLGSQGVAWMASSPAPLTPMRVLDTCCGLGGKSLHLAALLPAGAHFTCVEPQASKLAKLREAAARKRAEFETFHGSLQDFVVEHPHKTYSLVLVDAPCTGLGTLRRHPETRWRRKEADIQALVPVQSELLELAAARVQVGGALIYAVCTFTREEGPKQIEGFLERHPEFERVMPTGPLAQTDLLDEQGQLVSWPHRHDADAFFAARLRRTQ